MALDAAAASLPSEERPPLKHCRSQSCFAQVTGQIRSPSRHASLLRGCNVSTTLKGRRVCGVVVPISRLRGDPMIMSTHYRIPRGSTPVERSRYSIEYYRSQPELLLMAPGL